MSCSNKTKKTLTTTSVTQLIAEVPDLKVTGDGDMFQILCKASSKSENWMKTCKAMEIPMVGCVVQVTTQQGDHVAEALTFVPGVHLVPGLYGGMKLVKNS